MIPLKKGALSSSPNLLKNYWSNNYSEVEWLFMKLFFALLLAKGFAGPLVLYDAIPNAESWCRIIDCGLIFIPWVKTGLTLLFWIGLLLYLAEKKIILALAILLFCTMVVISIELSQGLLARKGIISGILLAQIIAYAIGAVKSNFDLPRYRIQYSLQIIAACYILAGISKVTTTGFFKWIHDGKYMSIQMLKGFKFSYVNNGDNTLVQEGLEKASFLLEHTAIFEWSLGAALLLELCAFIMLFGKKASILIGVALFSMHIVMFFLMNLFIDSFAYSCLAFCINPLFIVYAFFSELFRRYSPLLAKVE